VDRLLLLPPPSGGGGAHLQRAGLSVSPLRARLTLSSGGLLLRQWRRVFNRDGGELLSRKPARCGRPEPPEMLIRRGWPGPRVA
jgi:hypothetical protein